MTSTDTNLKNTPVAVDVMGGDFGPEVVVQGAIDAYKELGIKSILVGDEAQIKPLVTKLAGMYAGEFEIVHADEVVTMEDSPSVVIRKKPNSSLRKVFELKQEGLASSAISAGNTGAMMAAGLFVSGAIPGIARPAIASLIPRPENLLPVVLLDAGANVDCNASQLTQFAVMGSCYARLALGMARPRVALISNGTERTKGNDLTRAAAHLLESVEGINYVGYIEGKHICKDIADVVVCDGFVGNIVLKTMQGAVELVFDSVKYHVEKSPRGLLGMWLARPIFQMLFRDKLNPSAYGGAPLLGINTPAFVCHGASNSTAIKNAIKAADKFTKEKLLSQIKDVINSTDPELIGGYEDGIWDKMESRFDKTKKVEKVEESAEDSAVPLEQTKEAVNGKKIS